MLNCITVDDSTIQLKVISELVKRHPSLKLVGEFTSAIETKEALKNTQVDLVFLDIEMPEFTGFDLIDSLKSIQQVIIVSANKKHAYEAFKHEVTGFLSKPITKVDFDKSIQRAILFHENIFNKNEISDTDDSIFVKSNLIHKKIYLKNIKWIEAVGDYVKVVTDTENHLVLSTMKAFVEKLPENRFMRIHKSFIVNLDRVKEFNNKIVEIEGVKLPLSRTKKVKFFEVLNGE